MSFRAQEVDELQVNMDTISKELNALMVADDEYKKKNIYNSLPSNANVSEMVRHIDNRPGETAQFMNNMWHQQQPQLYVPSPAIQVDNTNHNRNGAIAKHKHSTSHYQKRQYHVGGHYLYPNDTACPLGYSGIQCVRESAPHQHNHDLSRVASQVDFKPKCEFHYLSAQSDNGKVPAMPLLSLTANDNACGRSSAGSFRKPNRFHAKDNIRAEHDYDKIVVDLPTVGISNNG